MNLKKTNTYSAIVVAIALTGCASSIFVKIPNLEGKNVDTLYKKNGYESGWYAFLSRKPNRQWQLEKITDSPNGYSGKYDEILFVNKSQDRVQPYFFSMVESYYQLKADPSIIISFSCRGNEPKTSPCYSSFLYPKSKEVEIEIVYVPYVFAPYSGRVFVTNMALNRPAIARAINDVDLFAKLPK